MSNALAIAAVTNTLRYLLAQRLQANGTGNVTVTTKPPDKARDNSNNGNNGDQVNLFLYQAKENAAWRNMEIPAQTKPGETGYPPLALDLYYLLTTYAQNDDYPDPIGHRLLGEAMSVFHDRPILFPEDIKAALPAADLDKYDLYNQIERVRITPQSLSLDELSKLWTTFQTQYRITVAYEVSVVLIESTRPTKSPPPVLTRGSDDRGVDAQASLIPPYPTLTAINFTDLEEAKQGLPPNQAELLKQPAARLGERLTLVGYNLDEGNIRVLFNHPFLAQPNPITQFESRTSTEIKLALPDPANGWLPGLYAVTVEVTLNPGTPDERILTTNGLPLPLAPTIVSNIGAARDVADPDAVIFRAECQPEVSEKQRVALILTVLKENLAVGGDPNLEVSLAAVSDRELEAKPQTGTTLKFELSKDTLARLGIRSDTDKRIWAGTYEIRPRLRVDGVDSAIVINYLARPPEFIGQQDLVIPP